MIIYSSVKNYYLHQGALQFTLNALGDPNKISVAVAANAAIMAYAKVGNIPIIDYDPSLNYRKWQLQASPTHFERSDKVYVYVRLSKTGDDAMLIFPYEKIPLDPSLPDYGSSSSDDGSSSSSDEGSSSSSSGEPVDADPNYYYIMLGALTASDNGGGSLVDRQWADGEEVSYGELDTARYWEDESSTELDKMFRIDVNNVIWTQHDLTFVNGAKLLLLRMNNFANNGTVDVTNIARAADITTFNFGANETSIVTTAGMEKYLQLFGGTLENKYLRKDQEDGTAYKLTMGEAEVTGDLTVGDDATVGGDLDVTGDAGVGGDLEVDGASSLGGNVTLGGWIGSDDFVSGLVGWRMDKEGNLEAETIHSRSAIITDELRVNRQQGQEGDTVFSDNDQIIAVEEIEEQDHSITYILTLKEKWEGYFTGQQFGNIIRGKVNTLAAKDAGVSDYTADEYKSSQGVDNGGNYYYTSYMRVINTHNTAPAMLEQNQIQVSLYGDNDVPMALNYPPCPLMTIVRAGCWQNPDEAGISSDERNSRIRRQSYFMISTTDGRIVKLTGVDTPKLRATNFGTTLGKLPEFIDNWTIASRLIDGRDYLYAQGVVVGDFIKVNIQGDPVVDYVFCGEWYDGGATGATPTVGHGIYLMNEHNDTTLRWETHEVRHYGLKWRCMQHQPVTEQGVPHYYEPKWNSPYWQFIEGDDSFRMEFVSSRGYRFHRGSVSTTITPHLYVGNEEITNEIAATYWSWTRSSDERTSATIADDEDWDDDHMHMKALTLTDADMPVWWATDNRIKFACHVQISDGKTLTFEL